MRGNAACRPRRSAEVLRQRGIALQLIEARYLEIDLKLSSLSEASETLIWLSRQVRITELLGCPHLHVALEAALL